MKAGRRRVWPIPIALASLTALGLVSALVGDGVWDAVSWVALAVPVAVCVACGRPRRRAVADDA